MSQKKVTDSVKIYDIRRSKTKQAVLADIYGVSRKTIYNIQNGFRYKNVKPRTLKAFPEYKIFQDGWILNKKDVAVASSLSDKVRIVNKTGKRVRVSVETLVQKAFG